VDNNDLTRKDWVAAEDEKRIATVNTPSRPMPWSFTEARSLDILSYTKTSEDFVISFLLLVKKASGDGVVLRHTAYGDDGGGSNRSSLDLIAGTIFDNGWLYGGFRIDDSIVSGNDRKVSVYLTSGATEYLDMEISVLGGIVAGGVSTYSWLSTAYYAGGGMGNSTTIGGSQKRYFRSLRTTGDIQMGPAIGDIQARFYFGDNEEGVMSMIQSGSQLLIQQKQSGAWVTISTFTGE
jgi:hypothetical protein